MTSTIRFYLSGGTLNTDPAASIGGQISQTEVTDLFSDIDPDSAAEGSVQLRCVYVLVADGGPVENPRAWFTESPDRSLMEVGVDPAGKNGTARSGANVAFSQPDDYLAGLDLPGGPYEDGDRVAIWLRRSSPSGARSGREAFNLRVRGLTAAAD